MEGYSSLTQKRTQRNISSLTDRIITIEAQLGKDFAMYAYHVAGGMKKSPAFISVWGYTNGVMIDRNLAKVMPLVLLLKEESQQYITEQLNMDKKQRLEHLLETALIARHKYDVSSEAAHGAVYLKAMTIINTMTGDNAPTEVHHLVSVTNEQLEAMTHSQRTESYKRMMSGNLELIDSPIQLNATNNNKGRTVDHVDEGGQP